MCNFTKLELVRSSPIPNLFDSWSLFLCSLILTHLQRDKLVSLLAIYCIHSPLCVYLQNTSALEKNYTEYELHKIDQRKMKVLQCGKSIDSPKALKNIYLVGEEARWKTLSWEQSSLAEKVRLQIAVGPVSCSQSHRPKEIRLVFSRREPASQCWLILW